MKRFYGFGFTLVEILLGIGIFTILITAIVMVLVFYMRNYTFSFSENQQIQEAQNAVTYIVKDIRALRYSDSGAWPIVDAQNNSFVFYSDVTGDGRSDRVRYYLNGDDIYKGVIEPTIPPIITYPAQNEKNYLIAENVELGGKSLFTYYNGDWPEDTVNNPLTGVSRLYQTRFVAIYYGIKPTKGSETEIFEVSTSVLLKNMKDNL